MPVYEGIVTRVKENGKAEVKIGPRGQCIPGAPEVTERICHTRAESSILLVEAFNRVSAEVGDMVSIRGSGSALIKNAVLLLGTPLSGLALGVAVAFFLTRMLAISTGALVATVILFFLAGLVLGLGLFKHSGEGNTPVVEHVIQTQKEPEASPERDNGAIRGENRCRTCPGFLSKDT